VTCGLITGQEQGELPAGRYLISVDQVDFDGPRVPRYFLRAEVVPAAACGDGVRAEAEACDDGNTAAGDGCNADCTLEAAARLTPRLEPYVVRGGPLAAGQATLLELALDQNARLLVDTFVPAEGRCEGPGEDGRLWLDGALFSDDGGVGRCPARGGRGGVGAVGPGVGPEAAPSSCGMIDDLTPPDFQSRRDERQL
jgi:cysteine-rich repeat protein